MSNSDSQKRAEADLRIAQIKFQQALKREESARDAPPPVSLNASTRFFDNVQAMLEQNTTENVQVSTKSGIDLPKPVRTD